MEEFERKKRIVDRALKISVAFAVIFILGAPFLGKIYKENLTIFQNLNIVVVIVSISIAFFFNRYRKAAIYVDEIKAQINDCGCYITAINAENCEQYEKEVFNNFNKSFFAVTSDVRLDGRFFQFFATKKRLTVYYTNCKKLTLDDYCELADAANKSSASVNIRKKAASALLIVCEKIDDEVIANSKLITKYGKSWVYPFIVNVSDSKAYFLNDGNKDLKPVLMNFLGYKDGVIDEKYKVKEKLDFQKRLDENMKYFSIKDYQDGKFNPYSER